MIEFLLTVILVACLVVPFVLIGIVVYRFPVCIIVCRQLSPEAEKKIREIIRLDSNQFDSAPFDSAPFDSAPFDSAQGPLYGERRVQA